MQKIRNLLVLAAVAGLTAWQFFTTGTLPGLDNKTDGDAIAQIRAASQNPDAEFWTTISGEVIKNLRDDTVGDRHQKFLIRIAPELTLLVSHNIDLAPRVPVQEGGQVTLRGEYVWNAQGGVMHWTHHDPNGRQGGWIEWRGQRYE